MTERGHEHAREVDAPMLLEVLILDGSHRVVKHPGALFVGHQDAPLQRKAADHLAVVGIDFRDHVGAISFERTNLRQITGVHEEQSASRAK